MLFIGTVNLMGVNNDNNTINNNTIYYVLYISKVNFQPWGLEGP